MSTKRIDRIVSRQKARYLSLLSILVLSLPSIGHAQAGWQISLTAEHSALLDKAAIVCAATANAKNGYDYQDVFLPPCFPRSIYRVVYGTQ